jgi:hypothetical protein
MSSQLLQGFGFVDSETPSDRDQTYADIELGCAVCGDMFIYGAGERQLASLRGVQLQPRLCPACRRKAFGGA